jgi:hypothetical protein
VDRPFITARLNFTRNDQTLLFHPSVHQTRTYYRKWCPATVRRTEQIKVSSPDGPSMRAKKQKKKGI